MIILYIVAWFLCGLFAVYLAGKTDKYLGFDANAPLVTLFIMGPFGILVEIAFIIGEAINKCSILTKIRDLGRK